MNKLIHGDALDKLEEFEPKTFDCIITDPPFGIDLNTKEQMYARSKAKVIKGYKDINKEDYFDFTENGITEAKRVLKDNGSLIIVSGGNHLGEILYILSVLNFTLINHIIWKYQFSPFTKNKFSTSHQHILFAVKNPKKYTFNKPEHYALDVGDIKRTYKKNVRRIRTQMPNELCFKLVKCFTNEGDKILDPFAGSGTILKIGRQLKRECCGIEIVRKHYLFMVNNLKT